MTVRSSLVQFFQQEDINFLLTNRVPRRLLTQFMGWFSRIEHPVVRKASMRIWTLFADLDLGEAKKTQFRSYARLLYPGTQGRRTAHRPGSCRPCEPVRRDCRRMRPSRAATR